MKSKLISIAAALFIFGTCYYSDCTEEFQTEKYFVQNDSCTVGYTILHITEEDGSHWVYVYCGPTLVSKHVDDEW